jgi:replicative DNA helicase
MLDPAQIDTVRDILAPEDMYADANRRILEAIYGLQDSQRTIDSVQVSGWLRDNNRLDQVGGTPYLAQIVVATPAVAHVEQHAIRVKEKAKQRVMIAVCQRSAAYGYGDVGNISEWLESVEKDVALAARDARDKEITWATYGEAARQTYKDIAESARTGATMSGYPTGFEELDNHVGGLAGGDFWIVGGYPGIGKTSLVKQTAENVAVLRTKNGARVGVVFFTLEMKYKQLTMRGLSRKAEVPFANVRIGRMQPNQWESLVAQAKAASDVAMIMDEGRDLTPFRMRRALRRHLAKLREDHGEDTELGLVCVDYIQLMGADVPNKNRATEIGLISKELKKIAGEFNCAMIGLSSLNRPEQKTRPKPPGMSALRESGALEFDADVILMIHRDDAFKEKHEQPDHLADLNVVKGRNSGASHHELQFDGRFTAFYPLGRELFPRVEANVYGDDWRDPA